MLRDRSTPRSRFLVGIALVAVIALGLASRRFDAVLPAFLADNAGDALWTMAVYLSLAVILTRISPIKLGLMAFVISVGVELSQLIDLDWLNVVRKTLPGRLLLGSGFVWIDLVRYFVGALVITAIDGLFVGKDSAMKS